MSRWLAYLKSGLGRRKPPDRFSPPGRPERTFGDHYRWFGPYLLKFRARLIAGIGLVFLAAGISFPLPLVSRFLIDDVILERRLSLLALTVVAIVTLALAGRLIALYQQYFFERLDQEMVLTIQSDLLERVLRFPKAFFDKVQTGYLMTRLESDVQGLGWFFSSTMVSLLENAVRFAGGLCFLFYLDWRLTLALILFLPGSIWLVRIFSHRLNHLSHANMEMQASLSGRFQESLSTLPLIKAFAAENQTLQALRGMLRKAMHLSLEQSTVSALAHSLINALPAAARAMVLLVGAYWVITDHWSLGSLFAYQAYLGYVFGPARVLAEANLQMQDALASLDRVANLKDIVPEPQTGSEYVVERLEGQIAFEGVSFAYDPARPILENLTFSIRAGERVAIAGVSGAGKTTLISLLLRLYLPTEGEIFYDASPASAYPLSFLRERLGYVAQQPLLLSGSIVDNMAYGRPDATHDEIVRALKAAGLQDFIADLPEGLGTEVGEKGILLSEGQKQRLSIARALLKNPDVILLDEPSASLDGQTGETLLSSLGSALAGKTTIIVSNEAPWLKSADRVLFLEGHRLAAMGTHGELLASNQAYASLVRGCP